MVIWITGLSGAGKTTLAGILSKKLETLGKSFFHLDGDQVREVIGDENIGHDPESRLTNAYRIARFARLLENQTEFVVVSTMSLFHEIHDWNRKNFKNYLEVFIEVPLDTLQSRDPKGLYQKMKDGAGKDMPGMDLNFDKPKKPHLIINNHDNEIQNLEEASNLILEELKS